MRMDERKATPFDQLPDVFKPRHGSMSQTPSFVVDAQARWGAATKEAEPPSRGKTVSFVLSDRDENALRELAGSMGLDISGAVERLLTAAIAGGWLEAERETSRRVSPYISRDMLAVLEARLAGEMEPGSLGSVVARVVRLAMAAKHLGVGVLVDAPDVLPEILEMRRKRVER